MKLNSVHRRSKGMISLCLSFSLAVSLSVSTISYADITIPPIPSNTSGSVSNSLPSQGSDKMESAPSNGGPGSSGPGVSGSVSTGSQNVTTAPELSVKAEGAALYNATTGQFLYEKNAADKMYPASITKLMTALLVAENTNLADTVTFSATATTNLEAGSVSLGITAGDKLTVEQCLYGLLLKSANEVANGLAEHISGSISNFTAKMNARAKDLGCTGTNFVNPNGLNNSNHYTTAHDMALIAAEAFKNETVRKAASTLSYQIPATKKAAARTVNMGHKMLYPNDARYYPGIVGGKTGYTSLAGNTLVTCAEKDGVRLIAVVLKSRQTHYEDTKAMLDYGFQIKGASSAARWMKDSKGWYFLNSDGSRPSSQWLTINNEDYYFQPDGYMAEGWQQVNGSWYYLRSSGRLAKSYWVNSGGNYYYVGENGVMLTNTTTPDGFWVNADGVWNQKAASQ